LRINGYRETLLPIRTLAVSDQGTLALPQAQDGAVRLFSQAGASVGSFGRRGEGPGEFQSLFRLGWHGDTVWVVDHLHSRISYISPSLEPGRIESHLPRRARLDIAADDSPPFTFSILPLAPGRDQGVYALLTPSRRPAPAPFDDYGTLG
jgi:hypothetical protein